MYKNIVVLTGAGISAKSGLKTFRGGGGLWENHRLEDVATPEAFMRDPQLVQKFYNQRRAQIQLPEVLPNDAHTALAEFEKNFNGDFIIITQNVDDLHEKAGSKNIHHMHGELMKSRCTKCEKIFEQKDDIIHGTTTCPNCSSLKTLRPHIVWFGEMPLGLSMIEERLKKCDLFLSIGTSGQVYPAAMFVEIARAWGRARAVEINIEETATSDMFHESLLGPAGEKVREYLAGLKD